MPYRDRTGPLGYGPLTGWGLGPCGRGLAWRRGGFGLGRRWVSRPWTKKEELEALKEEAELLKEELAEAEKGMREIKGQK